MVTRSLTIIEDGHRARSLYVNSGRVEVFDKDRNFRFHSDLSGIDTTWQLLSRIAPEIVALEAKALKLEALAGRCRTGWTPVAVEIDRDIRQRSLTVWNMAIDGLRYPDDLGIFYLPATKILGRDPEGRGRGTGEILWIAADLTYAVCDDGLYWLA